MPGRMLCERHCSDNPSRFKPKAQPTIEHATALLASDSKAKRRKGMEMLCELHADDLIVRHALKDTDALVLDRAWDALKHHPPELISHCLTQPSAWDASLAMRYGVALGNYLYAEGTIHDVCSKRRSLTLDVIEGIGGAYLRSLADRLKRFIYVRLELYQDALNSKGRSAVVGVEDGRAWSRKGWEAIKATIALTRLDAEFDVREIDRLLRDAERIQLELPHAHLRVPERVSRAVLGTRTILEWALFDKGATSTPERVISLVREDVMEVLPDLATTLLKQGNEDLLCELVQEFPLVYFVADEFCFWPLMNWLEYNGFLEQNQFGLSEGGRKGSLYPFWCALIQGIDPPPWWQWRRRTSR